MSNRRKFIAQSGLAATALMMAKPFNALAKFSSPLNNNGYTFNHITLLHAPVSSSEVAMQVKKIATKNASIVVLHENKAAENFSYDVSPSCIDKNVDGYKIIYKDNLKIGVVTAKQSGNSSSQINRVASYLKQEQNCNMVVCISELGFKNDNKLDDCKLAAESEYLDMIVSKHGSSSIKKPFIARNKNKAEVIIHHTKEEAALGKIRIGFNQSGSKHSVSF